MPDMGKVPQSFGCALLEVRLVVCACVRVMPGLRLHLAEHEQANMVTMVNPRTLNLRLSAQTGKDTP